MATLQFQGNTVQIPDDGQIFRLEGDQTRIFKRVGNNLVVIQDSDLRQIFGIPETQRVDFAGEMKKLGIDVNSIPTIPPVQLSDFGSVVQSRVGGGTTALKDINSIKENFGTQGPVTQGEVLTLSTSPDNPQAGILTSNLQGQLNTVTPIAQREQQLRTLNTLEQGDVLGFQASRQSGEPYTPVTAYGRALMAGESAGQGADQLFSSNIATGLLQASGGGFAGVPEGLPPYFQELYDTLNTYLKELQKRGQILNPNVEITPEKVAEFMKQAEAEIDPFYQNQLKIARESFLRSIGYATEDVLRQEKQAEKNYTRQLRELQSAAAEKGFALSGERVRSEQELAQETQEQLDARRKQLQFQTGTAARDVAGLFGAEAIGAPTIAGGPTVAGGETGFSYSGRQLPLYELDPAVYQGLVGQKEFERRGALKKRASELEAGYREQEVLKQQRNLIL